MDVMSLNKRGDANAVSVAQDLESLVPALHQFSSSQAESQAYAALAETVAKELTTLAEKGEGYSEARKLIQTYQNRLSFFSSVLAEMLAKLDHLEQARIRREEYSPRWWERTYGTLLEASEKDPAGAYHHWGATIAKALVDWELEVLARLVEASFNFPRDKYPYLLLIRHGNESLQKQDYPASLEMLNYLVGQLASETREELYLLSAQLLIFIGRIHLYHLNDSEAARQAFERAATLAPKDGRPLAALGHVHLGQGEEGMAEANRLFSRAVELSPDQPEPYVGKAVIAEMRSIWSEADEWYKIAVRESMDEVEPLRFLRRMLAPGSGRLYLWLARQFIADRQYNQALTAVEYCLDLGLEDGTSYPMRPATALKADILAAMSEADRTPEEALTIADLYFLAGKYYYWNQEHPQAIDLFRKSHELDERNGLNLLYLAECLRITSQILIFPYADEKLVRESQAVWEKGFATLSTDINSDTAWVYVARSMIEMQLARLTPEMGVEYAWRAAVFVERALLLNNEILWWTFLSNAYNWDGIALYANILYLMEKVIQSQPEDIFTQEEYAKVLINTGQYERAEAALEKLLSNPSIQPEILANYQSWQAMVDYYLGHYDKALGNLESFMQLEPNHLWAINLRANIYRGMNRQQDALRDEQTIWDRRDDPAYQVYVRDFAWSAYRLGMFQEARDRIGPFLEGNAPDERAYALLLNGMSCLALGDIQAADQSLSQAMEICNNPRAMADIVMELTQVQQRATGERWSSASEINSYLNRTGSILDLAQRKQKEMKEYPIDPVKELESVLDNPMTGEPGSASWTAAQLGLGRLHVEAGRPDAAEKAYLTLTGDPHRIPEAEVALKKIQASR